MSNGGCGKRAATCDPDRREGTLTCVTEIPHSAQKDIITLSLEFFHILLGGLDWILSP